MLIKGSDVKVVVTRGTTDHEEILAESFNFEPMLEINDRRFLGEWRTRKEEDFKGGRFSLRANLESSTYLSLIEDVVERAKRVRSGVVVNINATLQFRNSAGALSDKKRVHFPDVKFSNISTDVGSQEGYVEFSAEGEVENFTFITA